MPPGRPLEHRRNPVFDGKPLARLGTHQGPLHNLNLHQRMVQRLQELLVGGVVIRHCRRQLAFHTQLRTREEGAY